MGRIKLVTKTHLLFLFTSMVCLCASASLLHAQDIPPEPEKIIRRMAARYESVKSYQDTGVVRTVPAQPSIAGLDSSYIRPASFDDEVLVSFKTYFRRPAFFRFDWKGSLLRSSREAVTWTDGRKMYQWRPRGSPSEQDSFALESGTDFSYYVDEGTGTSAGSIFFVPSMLFEKASDTSFADMLLDATDLSLSKEDLVEGELCHVIRANLSGVPWTLWIDKKLHVLRKTRTLYSTGSFHDSMKKGFRNEFFAEEIHRDIRLNEPIAKEVFKYRPKLRAQDADLTRY